MIIGNGRYTQTFSHTAMKIEESEIEFVDHVNIQLCVGFGKPNQLISEETCIRTENSIRSVMPLNSKRKKNRGRDLSPHYHYQDWITVIPFFF